MAKYLPQRLWRFHRDQTGASAVEFAIVVAPFIFLLLSVLQMGIYYMAQSALNSGVISAAQALRVEIKSAGATFTPPTADVLKDRVVASAGALIVSPTLNVDVQKLATLSAGPVTHPAGIDFGQSGSTLALRARAQVPTFLPGIGGMLIVSSTAMLRRP